ncbi:hypothetical protein RYR30_001940 [Flavobacterium psychrophilum]|uniref:hypothetical protein n=1 Tax=Flavobacterium psychrophilum TaxID=96345 RepID=UPI000B7C267A|nr:hypothetical protein [Flavobacterium psychrophilum]EKT3962769.1 hypothetical protein [Flavobacterium psychrophilum]EKT4500944.1 hypothetical protein [Flavobacterium psychrophilum]EKT4508387.1 hypothetical protein [Flavobacterium psychrophilum]EKT4545822.1 hypothetical protein [Flavobacterium psychrophilum]EKT4550408.1 hypothetical protein [Flavobacterium psychrophilum]
MSICASIGKDIKYDCGNRSVAGIEQRLVLINESDLSAAGIVFDPAFPNALINRINLLPNKIGYEIQGIKQIMNYSNSLVADENSEDGVKHSITGIKIFDPSEIIRNEINKYIAGAKVYAVLERKWKGLDNKHAFLFFGLKFGLMISEMKDESADGVISMSLSTFGKFKEPYLPHIYRDTDYTTSLTAFNNKFSNLTTP